MNTETETAGAPRAAPREAEARRTTKETDVRARVVLDGEGR